MAKKKATGKNRSAGTGIRILMQVVLWLAAIVLTYGAAKYQKLTGPTYPKRGTVAVNGQVIDYNLIRSENTGTDALVSLPDPGPGVQGELRFKRYKTDDPLTSVPLKRLEEGKLSANLPSQPPAGKLEYHLELETADGIVQIPSDRSVVIRYKGAVPMYWLIPHIILMFAALLLGMRTLLEALLKRGGVRPLAWVTLVFMVIGGLVLGPIVQQYAFGAAWTGVPFGWDLTDNKVLVMFLIWLVAIVVMGRGGRPFTSRMRWTTVIAAIVMIATYLVPHSMYGSELDYSKVDKGVPPEQAIGQG